MLRIRVLDEAGREYAEAVQWYCEEDLDVARDMVTEYVARVRRVRQLPRSGTLVRGLAVRYEVRRFLLGRFSYAVYTAYLQDDLAIVAVTHQHRKPGYWRKRLAKATR
jgi:plasmid stabilization system protein ParE